MIIVFTGPTIHADDARQHLDARYLPPVAQGDVYRAALERPEAIAIIDGYFEHVPSVWHKEILWAMAQGIHVFGSSSMGALRAAELAQFGMEGIGAIFERYQSGRIEDDDEVAVAHASAEDGFAPLSVALVDMRATFDAALEQGVIDADARESLLRVAKSLYYARRVYPAVIDLSAGVVDRLMLAALKLWLPDHRVSQKREDALLLLRTLAERFTAPAAPKQVRYAFQHTQMWSEVVREAGDSHVSSDPHMAEQGRALPVGLLLEEVRLEAATYASLHQMALLHLCAAQIAGEEGWSLDDESLHEAIQSFAADRGMETTESLRAWLVESGLDENSFLSLLTNAAHVGRLETRWSSRVTQYVLDAARLSGDYGRIAARASAKQSLLAARGLQDPRLIDTGLTEAELYEWYFGERLGMIDAPDAADYAIQAGFASVSDFKRALIREYCYARFGVINAAE